eukprot:376498-Prorocentrum_minimum.AAC.5
MRAKQVYNPNEPTTACFKIVSYGDPDADPGANGEDHRGSGSNCIKTSLSRIGEVTLIYPA